MNTDYLRNRLEEYVATLDTDKDEWYGSDAMIGRAMVEKFLDWLERNP